MIVTVNKGKSLENQAALITFLTEHNLNAKEREFEFYRVGLELRDHDETNMDTGNSVRAANTLDNWQSRYVT